MKLRVLPTQEERDAGQVANAVLSLLMRVSTGLFGTPAIGVTSEYLMIHGAILIAKSEGKLLTATDIANYLGMPRPTVIRKLKSMPPSMCVRTVRDGNRVCFDIAAMPAGLHNTVLKAMLKALSKLDTKPVADSE